jgi:RHH-type transcriptional regulator, proline utilization regulon repressor / proline dehydrogenase / delta 1-pyrroline-5-carboxylate dehydrogenase
MHSRSPDAFVAPFAGDDVTLARQLLAAAALPAEAEARIDRRATTLIEAIRAQSGGFGGVEEMLREYSLSTKEGLALMVLAEALLRVPDSATADRLIEDKLGQGDFENHEQRSGSLLVSASAWALGITARLIQPGETPESILGQIAKRLGVPAVRGATRQAMRIMGSHFVLGQTIEEALARAGSGLREPSAIRSTCWVKARALPMTPRATTAPTPMRLPPLAGGPAMSHCRQDPASRSNCPPCTRAMPARRPIG